MAEKDPTRNREDEVALPEEGIAGEVPKKELAPEVEGQTPELVREEKRQATERYEVGLRGWFRRQLDSGVTLEEIDKRLNSDPPETPGDVEFKERAETGEWEAVRYGVFEEFTPVGSDVRSYFDKRTAGHERMRVGWNPTYKQYEVHSLDMSESSVQAVSTVPEVTKIVFDHAVEKKCQSGIDFLNEAGLYAEEILRGKWLEPENGDRAIENYSNMIRRLGELKEVGEKIAEQFGTDVPEEIRKEAEAKRAQIVEDWKKQLAELQKKDQIDKAKKEIAAI